MSKIFTLYVMYCLYNMQHSIYLSVEMGCWKGPIHPSHNPVLFEKHVTATC